MYLKYNIVHLISRIAKQLDIILNSNVYTFFTLREWDRQIELGRDPEDVLINNRDNYLTR